MKVVKFGGSSVANAEQISKIINIVTAEADRRIVVVSAPGKRTSDDTKVTDLLIALGEAVLAGGEYETQLMAVVERYAEIQKDLELPEAVVATIEADLRGRIDTRGSNDLQFMDSMKASGEDNNAKVIAEAFTKKGFPAKYVNPPRSSHWILPICLWQLPPAPSVWFRSQPPHPPDRPIPLPPPQQHPLAALHSRPLFAQRPSRRTPIKQTRFQ